MVSKLKPITTEDLQCLRPGDRVKWLINGGIEGEFIAQHGSHGIEWKRDDTGKSHFSPINLMAQLNVAEEQKKAEIKNERNNDINMRMAFELGYKACEKGQNIQEALAKFDELLRDPPTAS